MCWSESTAPLGRDPQNARMGRVYRITVAHLVSPSSPSRVIPAHTAQDCVLTLLEYLHNLSEQHAQGLVTAQESFSSSSSGTFCAFVARLHGLIHCLRSHRQTSMKPPVSRLFLRLNRPSSLTLSTAYFIPTLDCGAFSDYIITGQPCRVSREGCPVRSVRAGCPVWSVPCGVSRVGCPVWSVPCGVSVWSVSCGVSRVECLVWDVPCGVSVRDVPFASCPQPARCRHARAPGRGCAGAVPPCPGRSGRSPPALSRRWRVPAECGGSERCCCRQPGGCGPRDELSAPRRDGEAAAAAAGWCWALRSRWAAAPGCAWRRGSACGSTRPLR